MCEPFAERVAHVVTERVPSIRHQGHGIWRGLAEVIERDLGRNLAALRGAGAAGGLGARLLGLVGAVLKPGADLVMEPVGFARALEGAGLVPTGERAVDARTASGEAPAIAGRKSEGLGRLRELGADAVFSLCPGPMSLDEAMARAGRLLADAAEDAARAFLAGWRRHARRE